ncbi:hypothetical protein [Paenibacillus sp. FSL K6-2862]|uniref:hypothetical protein n=1 Tax=Paenibacillus sp. FSL K6-2862 TaxID=2921484 RepID=UPI0030F841C7
MTTRKRPLKRYAYITLDNIGELGNDYLDFILLEQFSDKELQVIIATNPTLLKALKLTKTKVLKGQVNIADLRVELSNNMKYHYEFFNKIVTTFMNNSEGEIKNLLTQSDAPEATVFASFPKMCEKEEIDLSLAINTLRFYKNGQYKEYIHPIYQFVSRHGHEEKEVDEVAAANENISLTREEHSTVETEIQSLTSGDKDDDFEDVIPIVNSLENLLHDLKQKVNQANSSYKRMDVSYYENLEELSNFDDLVIKKDKEIEEYKKQMKNWNKQTIGYTTEISQLKKTNVILQEKIDNQLKEHGKTSQSLGELRKEKEALQADNDTLKRKLVTYEKNQEKQQNLITAQLQKEFNQKHIANQLVQDQLSHQVEVLSRQFEESSLANQALQKEVVELELVLKKIRIENELIISERDDLSQKLNEKEGLKSSSVLEGENDDVKHVEVDDLFEFVNFNNQPS